MHTADLLWATLAPIAELLPCADFRLGSTYLLATNVEMRVLQLTIPLSTVCK